ncbi:hypothetical protein [Phycicoccus sonneratiae]|uniref:WXG100 family type VII secretion target n=1 Tax=Phycicoccus sonneratiae TaxID=2807628 RepID=A0ABS2CPZ2_9MICO|nr:hypothetical protein [Phycicoccus sonneraticus]MBM6401944.1 hypothetical protein [Phycicoccus sonneraticus]
MTARTQGMDTDEARDYARGMDSHAQGVAQAFGRLSSRIAGLGWTGSDFDSFRGDLETFTPQVHAATTSVEDNAHAMRRQADAQDAASA